MEINNFDNIEQIGQGAYGRVYRARQIDLQRVVALKVIDSEFPNAPNALEHARALTRVKHENIVKVHSIESLDIERDGKPRDVIVMDWLEGDKLGDRLAGDRFTAKEAASICLKIISGLKAMHANNIVHGDLHAHNIILVNGNFPVIIDVHPGDETFLSQLSLTTREAKISQDFGFCRMIIVMVLRHSTVNAVTTGKLDTQLVQANSLEQIENLVNTFLVVEASGENVQDSQCWITDQVGNCIEQKRDFSLRRLIVDEVKKVCTQLISEDFTCEAESTSESVKKRISDYEDLIRPLLSAVSIGTFFGTKDQRNLWKESIESIANSYERLEVGKRGGFSNFINLRTYPSLAVYYVAGLGAWLNDQFETLAMITTTTTKYELGRPEALSYDLYNWKAKQKDFWNSMSSNRESRYVPISDRLLEISYESFSPFLSSSLTEFENRFDEFEYFCGLVEFSRSSWGPVGRFIWKGSRSGERFSPEKFINERLHQILKAGFFDGQDLNLKNAVNGFKDHCIAVRREMGIF